MGYTGAAADTTAVQGFLANTNRGYSVVASRNTSNSGFRATSFCATP